MPLQEYVNLGIKFDSLTHEAKKEVGRLIEIDNVDVVDAINRVAVQ
jgi:hypothetical protein